MSEIATPPKWFLLLLWPFKGEPCYPQIEGDLNEEFQQRALEIGNQAARRWYFREVLRNAWALIWRGVTVLVILIPLLCSLVSTYLLAWLFILMAEGLLFRLSTKIIFHALYNLLYQSIAGLFVGVVSSRILRCHERMVRLVLGAFYLRHLIPTLLVFPARYAAEIHAPTGGMHAMRLLETYYSILGPVCLVICIWIGSVWIERHRSQFACQ